MSVQSGRPTYLTKRALRWLDAVDSEYEIKPYEMELLIATAEAMDKCQWARRRLNRHGSILINSHGNHYPNPAIRILEVSRNQFFAGCKLLKITTEGEDEEEKANRRRLRGVRPK